MAKNAFDPAVRVAASIGNATRVLADRVRALGGDYTEAMVQIGTGERRYESDVQALAAIYARISVGLVIPEGGRVFIIRDVVVDESAAWDEAIKVGFPNTPDSYNVWEIGEHYPPIPDAKPRKRDLILLNFGGVISDIALALAWGKRNNLPPASPREVFALGSHAPELNKRLDQNEMRVVSPIECTFFGLRYVPDGWWSGAAREADLVWVDGGFDDHLWFGFSRESLRS
ncbi:MAG: hypothetical protein PHV99_00355 [Candidatus Pacebacteria bacterium]|nr:hypothetical protein [Candidatus Paceibacterota bacterium]